METFYLGAHHPHWLALLDLPLFVSRRRLTGRRTLPRARAPWALDSGGFSELSLHGRWTLRAPAYAAEVRRYRDEIGRLAFAAPQDWMCEPHMLARTGMTVAEHQQRTVDNYVELVALAPDLPWMPVLQGFALADYLHCANLYAQAGVHLDRVARVGLGTICRRQGTQEAITIVRRLYESGLRLHAFGVKTTGLASVAPCLLSADSMAWSYAARRRPPLPECAGHKNCANCRRYAQRWHAGVLASLPQAPERYAYQLGFNWPKQQSVQGGARG